MSDHKHNLECKKLELEIAQINAQMNNDDKRVYWYRAFVVGGIIGGALLLAAELYTHYIDNEPATTPTVAVQPGNTP